MITREEVVKLARECGEQVVDWDMTGKPITNIDAMFLSTYAPFAMRFAQACYQRGIDDAAKLADECGLPDLYSQPCVDALAVDIRALGETK